MKRKARVFKPYPAPSRKDRLLIIFFGAMTLAGSIGWVREGHPGPTLVFLGFTLAASWLHYRLRIFGSPTIQMDKHGVRYRCGGREESAAWHDISEVQWDFIRSEIRFVRNDGQRPIRTHRQLVTDEGEWFDMLIEDYWKPPGRRQPT